MKTNDQILWTKIQNFRLDDPEASFSFSDRLAREYGWTKAYGLRVIEEYKKFIFLCCVSETGVTPSGPVDQAWHLHLTYTKSYWIDLCQNTIGKEIHHNPTKGGKVEASKFDGYYTEVQLLYEEKFGHPSPADIWQSNETRFSDINFRWVNTKSYWLIKKPSVSFKSLLVTIMLTLIATFFIQAANVEMFTFLSVAIVCFVVIVMVSLVVRFAIRPFIEKERNNRSDGSSCSAHSYSSCSGGDGGHSHSHSDGHSGCSGCSASGCSGGD